jgi:hypothetical protein
MLGVPSAKNTRDEIDYIRRALLRFRHDPEFRENGVRRVNIRALAALVDTDDTLLYHLVRRCLDYTPSAQWLTRVRWAVDLVLHKGLRFRRDGQRGHWVAYFPDGSQPVVPREMMRKQIASGKREGGHAGLSNFRMFEP